MYTSKHYTCEQIDQRLLQGYYDDAKDHGFTGSLAEFWKLVLSISERVSKKEGYDLSKNDFTDKLKEKLEGLEIPTNVSAFVNDKKYQTEDDVKKAINNLIDGSPKALDTLKELAEALADNPNFATEITNKLSQLQGSIDREVARAKDEEGRLDRAITSLESTVNTNADKSGEDLQRFKDKHEADIKEVNKRIGDTEKSVTSLSESTTEKIQQAKDQASDLISKEKDRAIQAENTNKEKISALEAKQTADKSTFESALQDEKNQRTAADSELNVKLESESAKRTEADSNLDKRLHAEGTERRQAIVALENSLSELVKTKDQATNRRIDEEVQDRKSDIDSLNDKVDDEAKQRLAKDTELTQADNDLKAKVESVRENLENSLSAETTAREKADVELKNTKVDKEDGKGLSSNDFTEEYKNKLDGIEALANRVDKVSQLQNDLKYQTEEQVEAAIQKVIEAAPDALNTLKELAEALDNDPNFSATVTNRITAITEQFNNNKQSVDNIIADIRSSIENANRLTKDTKDEILREVSAVEARYKDADNIIKEALEDYNIQQQSIVQTFTNRIEAIDIKVNGFENSNKQHISDNTAAIQRNLELIQTWEKDLKEAKQLFEDNITNLRDELSETDRELREKITKAVEDYIAKIAELDRTLRKYVLDSIENSEKINTIKSNLEAFQTQYTEKITEILGKFSTINLSISRQQATILRLTTSLETIQTNHSELASKVNTEVEKFNREISTSRSKEEAIEAKVNTNKQNIESLNLELEKIKKLTEEEVDTLVNDILEP